MLTANHISTVHEKLISCGSPYGELFCWTLWYSVVPFCRYLRGRARSCRNHASLTASRYTWPYTVVVFCNFIGTVLLRVLTASTVDDPHTVYTVNLLILLQPQSQYCTCGRDTVVSTPWPRARMCVTDITYFFVAWFLHARFYANLLGLVHKQNDSGTELQTTRLFT